MTARRSLVKNAADGEQVGRANRTTKDRQARLAAAYRAVMGSPSGRIVLWDILTRCHLFETITIPTQLIYALSGRRDVGLEVTAQLVGTDEDLYDLMAKEARAYVRHEEQANEAAHTVRATAATDTI